MEPSSRLHFALKESSDSLRGLLLLGAGCRTWASVEVTEDMVIIMDELVTSS